MMIPEKYGKIAQRASAKDRRYFQRNPDKTQYQRPTVYGEFFPYRYKRGAIVTVTKRTEHFRTRFISDDDQIGFLPGGEDFIAKYGPPAEFPDDAIEKITEMMKEWERQNDA